MRKYLLLIIALGVCLSAPSLYSQPLSFMSYRDLGIYQHTSPGAFRTGLFGVDNPALLNYNNTSIEGMFAFGVPGVSNSSIYNGGMFFQMKNSGFAMITTEVGEHKIHDYRYSLAFGGETFGLGMSYGFVGGDKAFFGRSNTIAWGALLRPFSFLSLSLAQTYAIDNNDAESVVDVAIRPIPNHLLTFFADYNLNHKKKIDEGNWSAGINWEFLNGIRVSGRYFQNKGFSVSLDLSMRYLGVGSINTVTPDNQLGTSMNYFRIGGPNRSIISNTPDNKWVTITLDDELPYRTTRFLNEKTPYLTFLLKLEDLKKENHAKGVIIDARKLAVPMEKAWEVRKVLAELKEQGKKIIVYLERSSIGSYYFASVADKIILDPLGEIELKGLSMSRSYYKDFFDKIGFGFEELRLYKYKSAVESFARDTMSEGDREQRQRLLDSYYETMRADICKSRNFTQEQFDKIVDDRIGYSASAALKAGLVDTTARWEDRSKMYSYFETGRYDSTYKTKIKNERSLFAHKDTEPFDDQWGGKKQRKIAVLFLEGDCSMESGIEGRSNAKILKSIIENPEIEAVVLRVDSPGGDAMASDYIADVVRQNKNKKPIIISQGSYAASGGYWLSMDGDTIVSSPFTLTGSIGVISSYIYDKGIDDALAIHTTTLKRGKYSDFGASWSLPFIGLGLPMRNLNADERKQMTDYISDLYQDFVHRVAEGRKLSDEEVHKVAQGRVWTGTDAKEHKLVDEIGGLLDAISIAKGKAKISKDEDVLVYQYPPSKLVDLSRFLSNLLGVKAPAIVTPAEINKMMYRLKHNGEPMHIIPADFERLQDGL